jgi:hypothetical protein
MRQFFTCVAFGAAIAGSVSAADDRAGRDKVMSDDESRLKAVYVSIDGRGTPAPKGAAWRRAVYGSLAHSPPKNKRRG